MIRIRTVVRALSIIMYRASRPGETIVAGACAIDIIAFAIAAAIFWATTRTTVGSRVSCRTNATTFSACTMSRAFWFTGAFVLRAVCACNLLRAVGPVETFMAQTHTFQANPLIRAIAWALLLGNFVLFNYFVNNLTTFPCKLSNTDTLAILVLAIILAFCRAHAVQLEGANLVDFPST